MRRGWMALGGLSVLGGLAWGGLVGCDRGDVRRQRLSSPNPLDRAQGVVEAYAARDCDAVPKLVDLLDDSDCAVRMYAIVALRRLCGEDYGYRYYESAGAREAAVRQWRDALRAGEVRVRSTTQPDHDPNAAAASGTANARAVADGGAADVPVGGP